MSLSLSHTANTQTFTVSWTAGVNNGSCKIQFEQGASNVWIDVLSPSTLDCDSSQSSVTVTLPPTAPWSAAGSKNVRLVRVSDSSIVGTFGAQLSCALSLASATPTPTVDEDCNGAWDNLGHGCVVAVQSKSCSGGSVLWGISSSDPPVTAIGCRNLAGHVGLSSAATCYYADLAANTCTIYSGASSLVGGNSNQWGSSCSNNYYL